MHMHMHRRRGVRRIAKWHTHTAHRQAEVGICLYMGAAGRTTRSWRKEGKFYGCMYSAMYVYIFQSALHNWQYDLGQADLTKKFMGLKCGACSWAHVRAR